MLKALFPDILELAKTAKPFAALLKAMLHADATNFEKNIGPLLEAIRSFEEDPTQWALLLVGQEITYFESYSFIDAVRYGEKALEMLKPFDTNEHAKLAPVKTFLVSTFVIRAAECCLSTLNQHGPAIDALVPFRNLGSKILALRLDSTQEEQMEKALECINSRITPQDATMISTVKKWIIQVAQTMPNTEQNDLFLAGLRQRDWAIGQI